MSTVAEKITNICIWCAAGVFVVMALATVGTLIWVGLM